MRVDFYCEVTGKAPVLEWLLGLYQAAPAQFDACRDLIVELQESGHRMRAPHSLPFGDGLFELRATVNGVQLRIYYFFHGQGIAIAAHHLAAKKTQKIPKGTLDTFKKRKALFESEPEPHRHIADLDALLGA